MGPSWKLPTPNRPSSRSRGEALENRTPSLPIWRQAKVVQYEDYTAAPLWVVVTQRLHGSYIGPLRRRRWCSTRTTPQRSSPATPTCCSKRHHLPGRPALRGRRRARGLGRGGGWRGDFAFHSPPRRTPLVCCGNCSGSQSNLCGASGPNPQPSSPQPAEAPPALQSRSRNQRLRARIPLASGRAEAPEQGR